MCPTSVVPLNMTTAKGSWWLCVSLQKGSSSPTIGVPVLQLPKCGSVVYLGMQIIIVQLQLECR